MRPRGNSAEELPPHEDLLEKHAPLVKRIAYHLVSRLPPSVQVDDLIQAGMIGLLEAARNYDGGHNASFTTYAGIRVRGAMLDEIRQNDWTPRSVHAKARKLAEAIRSVENKEGRDARAQEIADSLGVSLEEYHTMLQDANGQKVLSLDEISANEEALVDCLPDNSPSPLEGLQEEDMKRGIVEAIAGLPERERLVMALYYDEELNLREIGMVMGLSESRISQIHSQAVLRLQARMAQWRNS